MYLRSSWTNGDVSLFEHEEPTPVTVLAVYISGSHAELIELGEACFVAAREGSAKGVMINLAGVGDIEIERED
jgi:hypothetical protein